MFFSKPDDVDETFATSATTERLAGEIPTVESHASAFNSSCCGRERPSAGGRGVAGDLVTEGRLAPIGDAGGLEMALGGGGLLREVGELLEDALHLLARWRDGRLARPRLRVRRLDVADD
jgi:hypothetical protein